MYNKTTHHYEGLLGSRLAKYVAGIAGVAIAGVTLNYAPMVEGNDPLHKQVGEAWERVKEDLNPFDKLFDNDKSNSGLDFSSSRYHTNSSLNGKL